MMNGRRKSDRPVVVRKPANKVGASVNDAEVTGAEQVERRGLGQREDAAAKHEPGTGPGRRAKCAEADTASSCERYEGKIH